MISSFEKWYARSCVSDAIYEIIIEMILIVGKFMICNIQWDRLNNKFNVNSCCAVAKRVKRVRAVGTCEQMRRNSL